MKPTVMDLFSGCGGLSSGLAGAGFDIRWANDIDKDATETYKGVHDATVWTEDASQTLERIASRDRTAPRLGEVDLLAGGPPCNGFTGYNRYRSPNDSRNSLVELFLNFVELLQPRFVLMENVTGMLQMSSGRIPRLLLTTMQGLGYDAQLGILQAGYYGLPQNRWRVFILAAKHGDPIPKFPEPHYAFPLTTVFGATKFRDRVIRPMSNEPTLFGTLNPTVVVQAAIGDLPFLANGERLPETPYRTLPNHPYEKALRDGSTAITNHACRKLGELMMERIQAIPHIPGAGWVDLPDHLKPKNLVRHGDGRYKNRFGRLWWEGTFNTIVSEPNPYWGRVIHPDQDRVISVREAARAQGIHDSVRFSGNLSSQYRQVGNAVPPILSAAIGKEILSAMGN